MYLRPHDADHHLERDFESKPPPLTHRRHEGLSPRRSGREKYLRIPPLAAPLPAASSAATNEAISRRKGGRPHRVSTPTGTKRSTPPSHRPHSPYSLHADLFVVQSQSSVLSEKNHNPSASNATTTSPRRDHPLAFSGFFDGQLAARRLRPVIGPVPSGGPFPSPRGISLPILFNALPVRRVSLLDTLRRQSAFQNYLPQPFCHFPQYPRALTYQGSRSEQPGNLLNERHRPYVIGTHARYCCPNQRLFTGRKVNLVKNHKRHNTQPIGYRQQPLHVMPT